MPLATNPPKKIAILGAGISGLSLAWHLQKHSPLDVTLYEASATVGGFMRTDEVDDAFYEWGPHTLRLAHPHRETCMDLIEQVGLKQEIYLPQNSTKKLLCYDSKLWEMPSNPLHLLKPFYLRRLVFPLLKEPFRRRAPISEDISIYSFFHTRYGEEFCKYFIDPLVTGIFGGDPKTLSLKACFPAMDKLKNARSLALGLMKQKKKHPSSLMLTFKKGLESLPKAIKEHLNAEFCLETPVTGLDFKDRPCIQSGAIEKEYDYVFSCLPAQALGALLPNTYEEIKTLLASFKAISYKVIHLGFSSALDFPKSFGFLSPSWSQGNCQGVIFDSCVTPLHDSKSHAYRLTALLSERSPLFSLDGQLLIDAIKQELSKYLKVFPQPIYEKLYSFPEVLPQYEVGHQARVKQLQLAFEKQSSSFSFGGKSFYGGSVPACISGGKQVAETFLRNHYQTA